MATTFRNQVASINACAAHFAERNYHVEATYYTNSVGCRLVVFFDDIKQKEMITRKLRCFADEGDGIEFKELECGARKFYTLSLTKDVVL